MLQATNIYPTNVSSALQELLEFLTLKLLLATNKM